MKAIQTKESVIEDVQIALAFLYNMEYGIDISSDEFGEFEQGIENFLKVQTMKYVWKYWYSIERYILSLNNKPNTYFI